MYPDVSAPDRALIENLDRVLAFRFSLHLYESESLGEARFLVGDQFYALDFPELVEHISQFVFGKIVRKISNINLH